jgi:hypothetical protein
MRTTMGTGYLAVLKRRWKSRTRLSGRCDRRPRGQSSADGQAGRSRSERQQTRNQPLLLRVLCDWRWLPGTGVADDCGLNSFGEVSSILDTTDRWFAIWRMLIVSV